jgi:hypothetical protein
MLTESHAVTRHAHRQAMIIPVRLLLVGAVLLAASGAGCGRRDGPQRTFYPIRGTVTLDGKPLPYGEIQFVTPSLGHLDVCVIKNGRFTGQAGPGKRTVSFCAFREGAKDPETGAAIRLNVIPPRYSTESNVEADVTAEGPNDFAFDLTSK